MLVIGVTGPKRSGKDTVADRLVSEWGAVKVEIPAPITAELAVLNPWCRIDHPESRVELGQFVRFADLVAWMGVDAAKDVSADVRAYQQRYGTDLIRARYDNMRWAKLAAERLDEAKAAGAQLAVVPNVRQRFEVAALVDVVLRVVRPGYDHDPGEHAVEQGIPAVESVACWAIANGGSVDDLHEAVDVAVPYLAVHRDEPDLMATAGCSGCIWRLNRR